MKVLIVEPSKALALAISRYLNKKGIETNLAHSAQAGIAAADKNKPDLVILELLINEHNGLEFIHEFKSYHDWFDIPIIIYSDLSAEEIGKVPGWEEDMTVIKHFYKPTTTLAELNNFVTSLSNA